MSNPRIQSLRVGVSGIERWRVEDEVHLPERGQQAPLFLPETRPLDAILKRETLEEKLLGHLVPNEIDAELMKPSVMTAARHALRDHFADAASQGGPGADALAFAANLMETEVELDAEIQEALAALLRG
jgi:hypothetical protein